MLGESAITPPVPFSGLTSAVGRFCWRTRCWRRDGL